MTDQTPEVIAEFVDLADLQSLLSLQKDLELAEIKAQLIAHKIEIQKLLVQKKYKLGDADQIDGATGKITRVIQ